MSYKSLAVKAVTQAFFSVEKITDITVSTNKLKTLLTEIFNFDVELKSSIGDNPFDNTFYIELLYNDEIEKNIHVSVTVQNSVRITGFN